MRDKARIAKLTASVSQGASRVEWPTAGNSAFHNYKSGVYAVLQVNDIPGEWDFDEETRTFYAEWSRPLDNRVDHSMSFGGSHLITRRNVTLDPSVPLAAEIERLAAEHAAFIAWGNSLSRLVSGV